MNQPYRISRRVKNACVLTGLFAFLVACGESQNSGSQVARLPISLNEVMASLINHSADPIWAATWRNPQSVQDWRELQHLAKQLQVGGALLAIPGTGPLDVELTSDSEWQEYSRQLADAAGRAANAAGSNNLNLIAKAGDEIVEICEACHAKFKLDVPTMNIYGDLSPLPSDTK